MSPEQVQGFPIDHRSDIFAIGTCLFEMLTSQSLFRGDNDFITLERVRKAEVPNPTDINPKIPKSLEKIVLKALALDPKDRWQRAADLQDALQRFLITSPPIYTAKRLADWMKLTFAPDIDADKGRMEEFGKLGPEVLRRSVPPSAPPPMTRPTEKKMAKTMMGMPAVAPARPPAPGVVATPFSPPAENRPSAPKQISKPPPPPVSKQDFPAAVAMTLPATPVPPPLPPESTPVTAAAPGAKQRAEQKIIAIPKGPGAGMTTTAVKSELTLDYEEDEEPTQALDQEANDLDNILAGKVGLPDEVVYSDKPVARRQPTVSTAGQPRVSFPPGMVIGPDGQPQPIPMPQPQKSGFNPMWILVFVVSFVVVGVGGVVVWKMFSMEQGFGKDQQGVSELGPDQAALDLRVVPSSAGVRINGKDVPEDQLGFPIKIPVNTAVDVEVYKDGYKRETFQILAGPREKIRKEIALMELRGRVMVNSVPEKAKVYMDSVLKGETPITLDDFPINRKVNVSVQMESKETWAEVVELNDDKPERTLVAILQETGKKTAVAKVDVPVPKVTTPKVEPKTTPKTTTPKTTTPKTTTPKTKVEKPAKGSGGEMGGLIAHTTPWARVIVDGKDTGRNTPIVPKKPIMLPPGSHKVTFKIQSTGQTYTFPVTIKAGQDTKLVKKLE
jgi:hypothetical protein